MTIKLKQLFFIILLPLLAISCNIPGNDAKKSAHKESKRTDDKDSDKDKDSNKNNQNQQQNTPPPPPPLNPLAVYDQIKNSPAVTPPVIPMAKNARSLIERAALYCTEGVVEAGFATKSDDEKSAAVNKVLTGKNFKAIFDNFTKMRLVHRLKKPVLDSVQNLEIVLSAKDLAVFQNPNGLGAEYNDTSVKEFANIVSLRFSTPYTTHQIKYAVLNNYKKIATDPSLPYPLQFSECQFNDVRIDDVTDCLVSLTPAPPELDSFVDKFLHLGGAGVGFGADYVLGTDKFVFSILGFNSNIATYGPHALIFKPSMMAAEKTWLTPVAATSFYGTPSYGVARGRPWVSAKPWAQGGQQDYNDSKYNEVVPGTVALVSAVDVLARVKAFHHDNLAFDNGRVAIEALIQVDLTKKCEDITIADIRNVMMAIDSHALPEAHSKHFFYSDQVVDTYTGTPGPQNVTAVNTLSAPE